MPEYLAPGVFIEEIERGPKPIEGVATSTAAFLEATERGPSRPRLITSYNEYLRIFGDIFGTDNYMPYAVKAFFDNGGRRCYIARIAGAGAAKAIVDVAGFTVTAYGVGEAYNEVDVLIGPGTTLDGNGDPIGFRLVVTYRTTTEAFDDLSVDPGSQNFYKKRVNRGNSALVELDAPDNVALPAADASDTLAGGADGGALGVPEYEGNDPDPNERTGLAALDLDPFREVAIVYAPGAANDVAQAVITHVENNTFRVAVIDSQPNQAVASNLDPRSTVADSQYAALYYPWYFVSDPRSGDRTKIPPGGAVCGIYALTDNTRGVFKAPANEVVAGAIDLEYDVDQGTQEVLNPRGVNAIRRFPGRGIRVWGARTLSSDPLWKYVNVRRLLVFLEASIYNSTQWVVFEPNDPRLWKRVEQTITFFLRGQWRAGALFGDKEEEAFSVAVDRSTMTEDDILNGRLIVEIGVAPVRPAEFVVFRIFQKTQEAKA
jgi:phage tail sheath protein FI